MFMRSLFDEPSLAAVVGAQKRARMQRRDGPARRVHVDPSGLIGRGDALAALADAIRVDRPVAVVGEAGIGKTALVRAAAAATDRALHEGGGFATLSWLPYLAIRRATGTTETGDPERVAAAVERAVGPDLLFIDDLQWTDDETRAVVPLLLGRIAIVVAIREGDGAADTALEPLREHGVEIHRLAGLDDEEAAALAARVRPGLPPERLQRIVELAGGNPLLIEELAIHGQSSSSLTRAITGQLALLGTADRATLDLIALAGRPLPANAFEADVHGMSERGLLRRSGDDLEIRHSLIAEAIVEEIEDARRPALHARLASVVNEPAERARHLAAAGQRSEALAVARGALAAATDPRERALLLSIAGASSDGTEGTSLRVRAAVVLGAIGSYAEAAALLDGPLDGDDDTLALAASIRAGALSNDGRLEEARSIVESTRTLHPTPGGAASIELMTTEASILVNSGRLGDAIELIERASSVGSPAASGYRMSGHLAALRLYAGATDQLDMLEGSINAAFASGDGGTAAGRAIDHYYMTLALRGGAAAVASANSAADRLEALGYHKRATELRAESMQAAIFAGDLAGSVVAADSMLEEPLGFLSRQRLAYNRGFALGLMGHAEDADRTLAEAAEQATDDFDGRGAVLWCWAEACLWGGQPARALEMATASLELTAFNDAEFVLPSLARAWAEVELGRVPTAASVSVPFRCLAGAVPEFRGLQALAAGDHRAAGAAFDEAADLWAGFHIPRELLCRWAAGDALGRAGDRDGAVARLREAEARATSIGFEPLAARARRSLRLAGERPSSRSGTRAGGLLTGREREILALVEGGRTNAEIARRMSLGRPTVARMLSNAMLKLGAESRAQAVVLASRLE
jgi:DNA-binding CsgD family transcriptional regulator/tetratricopeptide (TPR) repeat protein